ncbi:hypothetical protein V565_164360, partial [Rhizoctonia solani 123E]
MPCRLFTHHLSTWATVIQSTFSPIQLILMFCKRPSKSSSPSSKRTRLAPSESPNSYSPDNPLSHTTPSSLPLGLTQNTASRNTWEETIWQFRNKSL